MLSISVVVPTYRRALDLRRCLAALGAQRRAADQIVVVCRDEDAESRTAAAEANNAAIDMAVVREGGAVAAYNAGLDAARGDVVAIIDDDTAPPADWLEKIAQRYADDPRLGALGGRDIVHVGDVVIPPSANTVGIVQFHGRVIGNHHVGYGGAREVHVLKGANMSFRVAALAGGRFDRRLLGTGAQVHLEIQPCATVLRNGWRQIYDPEIVVDHFPAVRHDEDVRNHFSATAQYNAVHNETLALLDFLPAWRRPVFLIWAVTVGTRAAPGMLQMLRLRMQGDVNAWPRLRASLAGRWAGLRRWRLSHAGDNAPKVA